MVLDVFSAFHGKLQCIVPHNISAKEVYSFCTTAQSALWEVKSIHICALSSSLGNYLAVFFDLVLGSLYQTLWGELVFLVLAQYIYKVKCNLKNELLTYDMKHVKA
jgi:hypothetical protein